MEIKVNDSELENEELRERLGMDPKETLNIEDVRHKKKVKAEQAVALNRALTKEVICRVDNTLIGGHLELVPTVHQSFYYNLILFKGDTSLKRTMDTLKQLLNGHVGK